MENLLMLIVKLKNSYMHMKQITIQQKKEDYAFWEGQQKSIINWALNENGFNKIEDLPKINQVGQIILTGLVIVADWLASNDEYFPLIDISEDLVDNTNRKENDWSKWFKTYVWEPDNKIDDVKGILEKLN